VTSKRKQTICPAAIAAGLFGLYWGGKKLTAEFAKNAEKKSAWRK
jgi:hypothetical protein